MASILVVSAVLRIVLCLGGGQNYWPDETRDDPDLMLHGLLAGDYREVLSPLDNPRRPVFTTLAMIPTGVARITGHAPTVEALFFSMSSVISIWLLAAVARVLGADDIEAVLAAGLLAISSSFLYWSRHIQSYDLAMTFGLLALLVGLGRGDATARLYWCGLIAGLVVLTYPGYWTTVVAVACLCIFQRSASWRDRIVKTSAVIAGFATIPVVAIVVSAASGGQMLARLATYSGTIAQGSFEEGWSLPFEYLWHAEHLVLVLWLASALWAMTRFDTPPVVGAALFAALLIYGMLVLFSVGYPKFVVYGRLARQLVPFLCLVTSVAVATLLRSPRAVARIAGVAILGTALVQAAFNFRQPLWQSFPDDFMAHNRPADDVAARYRQLRWVNTEHLYPRPEPVTLPPHSVTLAVADHPLEFLPYQYEGFTPENREVLRSTDIRMRLVGVLP
jgi:hypothetical protein